MRKHGLIHLYTGDGKGKTTAGVGLCVRAAGAGLRVLFVQFMKGRGTSELGPLEALGVTVFRKEKSKKFVRDMTEEEKALCRAAQGENFAHAERHAANYDLLVMDEVISAVTSGMLDLDAVLAFLDGKPQGLEVVLTGRNAPQAMHDRADAVSNLCAIRHPYTAGVPARKGIEF